MRLLATSSRIALGSAVALGAQALFGVLMLRLFLPDDVGLFTLVSQIAFFWMTLALAQSPLRFLANIQQEPRKALHEALRSSLLRWLYLSPLAAIAIWFAALSHPWRYFIAAAVLAVLQMGWYLAQPWALRAGSAWSAACVRAAPPLVALVLALCVASADSGALGLIVAASVSYAAGAAWLWQRRSPSLTPAKPEATDQFDDRSAALRMAHTVSDAVVGTAVLLVWQRLHGLADASYLAVLLRLLGLFPTIVHAAWPQVLLSRGHRAGHLSAWVGAGGALGTAIAGLVAWTALRTSWIPIAWNGLADYLLPLVLWQGLACLFSSLGHVPFQRGLAVRFSQSAIVFNAMQLAALALPLASPDLSAVTHLWWLAGTASLGLAALSLWLARENLK